MSSLSEPFIRRPAMTTLLTVTVILFGVLAYFKLPVNDLPAVDYPVITVNVVYPGASPTTMANNVATPLERQFMQISGLELVTSSNSQGHSSFTLQFSLNKSIDAAATDVQTAISQASGSLPTDLPSPPVFAKTNPNDQAILYVALSSNSITAGKLYEYASTQVSQRVSIVNGVSRVDVYGTKAAIRIKADPELLAARGISIDDLAKAVSSGTSYQSAGQFDGANRSILLQPKGQLESAAGFGNLIVAIKNGAPVYLKNVAKVEDSVADERMTMHFWVRGADMPTATCVIAVYRQAGSNAVEVAANVRALLPVIKQTLPSAILVTPIYDRSVSIVNSVQDVKETLLIAFVLVVIVIFLFLGRVTDTLIPAMALPLSLLLTIIAMYILGYSFDNLSLMALTLAIGFLVDDAIVFLENTVRRMELGEGRLEATLKGAQEISFTILSMTLSLAAVFIPLVFMPGLIGRIFREFAATIIISIIASGIVSLTLTPLMCARMLGARGHNEKKTLMERLANFFIDPVIAFYGTTLSWFLKHKWISALIWIACLYGTGWLAVRIPKSFLPTGDSGFLLGVQIGKEGASPQQMRKYQLEADRIMQSNPDVGATFTMSGNTGFAPSNFDLLLAFLNPVKTRKPIAAVAGQMMGDLMQVKGTIGVLNPQPVLQISTGATSNLQGKYAYSISGINPQETYATANKLMAKLRATQGIFSSINADLYNNTPNLDIEILRDEASSYGVSVTRIETLLRQAYSQNYVYLIKKPDDQYQVIIEVLDKGRSNPDNLEMLYVTSDDGTRRVPLRAVAKWHETVGPQSVNHINQFTSVTISFNLFPDVAIGDATTVLLAAAAEVIPPGIRGELRGEAQDFQNTLGIFAILMLLAVFVMYVILGILYESYIHPITVLSSLPVALVGGLWALYLYKAELSLYAGIGMFMLMGIVKKNGIMMIDFALQRSAEGRTSIEAIHHASVDRFRPIIMTTLAALMGAIPIALGYGADGESRRPLGLVIVGGLVVSQVLTLYVTPVIYLYMEWFQANVLDRFDFFRSHRTDHLNVKQ